MKNKIVILLKLLLFMPFALHRVAQKNTKSKVYIHYFLCLFSQIIEQLNTPHTTGVFRGRINFLYPRSQIP